VDLFRDANAARFGQRFEPGRDIDPIAVKIAALDHHVAEIDADAEHDPDVFSQAGIGRLHGALQFGSAGDSIDGAGKLYEHAVAHHFDDATVVLVYRGLEDVGAPRPEGGESAGFVGLHHPAVADDISSQDGGKAALDALFGHVRWLCFRLRGA